MFLSTFLILYQVFSSVLSLSVFPFLPLSSPTLPSSSPPSPTSLFLFLQFPYLFSFSHISFYFICSQSNFHSSFLSQLSLFSFFVCPCICPLKSWKNNLCLSLLSHHLLLCSQYSVRLQLCCSQFSVSLSVFLFFISHFVLSFHLQPSVNPFS